MKVIRFGQAFKHRNAVLRMEEIKQELNKSERGLAGEFVGDIVL
jgi:hypothetical protein